MLFKSLKAREDDMEGQKNSLSLDEIDIFQEIINIAFGWASANLAEVIDIYVILSVPEIELIPVDKLPEYLAEQVKGLGALNVVEQSFLGKFMGYAYLVFPSGFEKDLLVMMNQDNEDIIESNSLASLQSETLLDVGNILIGACVGKISELLNDVVTYSPPRVHLNDSSNKAISKYLFDPGITAILMKTVFSFEKRDINGFMFLITNDESIIWLKTALNAFMEQYE